MAVPKTAALPLGDTPKAKRVLKGARFSMQQRLAEGLGRQVLEIR
jgi:hypothetical protein